MKLSLKTKFYIYILPLLIVLPVLLYSLVAPYTQLRTAFDQFKNDAGRAKDSAEMAELLDNEQLELFHLLSAAPDTAYDITTNLDYKDFQSAQKTTASQLKNLQSQIGQDVQSYDEEKQAIDDISQYYGQFSQLEQQALAFGSQGKKQAAYDLAGQQIGNLVDGYLRPEIQILETIKEDDVKTSLPDLTETLTRHGVIPIPGLQNHILNVLNYFENSVDTERLGQLFGDLQSTVFYEVLREESGNVSAYTVQSDEADLSQIQNEITATFGQIQSRLPSSSGEITALDSLQNTYQQLLAMDNKAVDLGENGQQQQALDTLRGQVDIFSEQQLTPQLEQFISQNQQDVQGLINDLSKQLDTIINWLYIISSFVFLLGLYSMWKLSRDIISPIISLRDATLKLSAGDFSVKVPVISKDEIGELAQAFNGMGKKLNDLYGSLEQKVRQQTVALSKQVNELETTKKAMLNVLEDVNVEKTKAQSAQAQDEAMISSIGEGMIVTDQEGKITLVNKPAQDLLGYKLAEMMNKSFTKILIMKDEGGKEVADADRPLTLAFKSGKQTFATAYYLRKDQTSFPAAITVAPIITNEKITGAIETFRDITHEKEIDKAKTEFVSLASHQLRTPLTAIGWYAEMLMAGDAGKLKPQQQEFVGNIHEGNQRMVALVNSLLNVSRIELGSFEVNPVPTDIPTIAESLFGEMAQQIQAKQLVIRKDYDKTLSPINVDPQLMRMVLQNLLTNAIKYTPEKGKINLEITKKARNLSIVVADTGYGIPKNQQSKIFSKLFRADNAIAKEADGNGLGLYIVKAIVEQSDGKIWFESEENKGTTFYIELPLSGMKKKQGAKALT